MVCRNMVFVLFWTFNFFSLLDGNEHLSMELTGRLIKKTFDSPRIVKNPAFGWFLELDERSENILKTLRGSLEEEDKRLTSIFKLRHDLLQLLIASDGDKAQCNAIEGKWISVKGNIANPPYLCSPIPVYQMSFAYDFFPKLRPVHLSTNSSEISPSLGDYTVETDRHRHNISPHFYGIDIETLSEVPRELPEGEPEILVKLTGKLILRLSPGPPNYSDVEAGDYPSYVWYLQMDSPSVRTALSTPVWGYPFSEKEIMDFPNWFEVQLGGAEKKMEEWFCDHIDQTISMQGYLFHAHTGHHHAPFLLAWENVEQESEGIEQ